MAKRQSLVWNDIDPLDLPKPFQVLMDKTLIHVGVKITEIDLKSRDEREVKKDGIIILKDKDGEQRSLTFRVAPLETALRMKVRTGWKLPHPTLIRCPGTEARFRLSLESLENMSRDWVRTRYAMTHLNAEANQPILGLDGAPCMKHDSGLWIDERDESTALFGENAGTFQHDSLHPDIV